MLEVSPGKILVVDDTPANRYAAVRILKTAGHKVLEAGTAAEAMAVARDEQPNVILLDVKLPDMVGFEATERLKTDPDTAHIAILQVSASYTSADARALGLQRGADAYLTLPIESQILLATVNSLLRMHRAERDLQAAVRTRDEFLSIASHDLRTPLTSIRLSLELTMRRLSKLGGEAESVMVHLQRVSSQTERLGDLLDNLLDISQISAGTISMQLEQVDLVEVVFDAIARFQDEAARSGSVVSFDAPTMLQGRWDRLRLEQITANLLSNAIKYGDGKPIELAVSQEGGRARLMVKDHGVGIPKEQQRRIFERFERVGQGRSSGSYGLGLWIVRRITDALGGNIHLASAPQRGSCFTVELPLIGPAAAVEPTDKVAADG